jgi:hypothetical protein
MALKSDSLTIIGTMLASNYHINPTVLWKLNQKFPNYLNFNVPEPKSAVPVVHQLHWLSLKKNCSKTHKKCHIISNDLIISEWLQSNVDKFEKHLDTVIIQCPYDGCKVKVDLIKTFQNLPKDHPAKKAYISYLRRFLRRSCKGYIRFCCGFKNRLLSKPCYCGLNNVTFFRGKNKRFSKGIHKYYLILSEIKKIFGKVIKVFANIQLIPGINQLPYQMQELLIIKSIKIKLRHNELGNELENWSQIIQKIKQICTRIKKDPPRLTREYKEAIFFFAD